MPEPSSPYIEFNKKNNPSSYPKTNGTKKKKETYKQLELPLAKGADESLWERGHPV